MPMITLSPRQQRIVNTKAALDNLYWRRDQLNRTIRQYEYRLEELVDKETADTIQDLPEGEKTQAR